MLIQGNNTLKLLHLIALLRPLKFQATFFARIVDFNRPKIFFFVFLPTLKGTVVTRCRINNMFEKTIYFQGFL